MVTLHCRPPRGRRSRKATERGAVKPEALYQNNPLLGPAGAATQPRDDARGALQARCAGMPTQRRSARAAVLPQEEDTRLITHASAKEARLAQRCLEKYSVAKSR